MRLCLIYAGAVVLTGTWMLAQWSGHWWIRAGAFLLFGILPGQLLGRYWRPITEWLATGLCCHWSCVACRLRHTTMADIEREIVEMRAINRETDEAMRVWREQMAKDAEGRVN